MCREQEAFVRSSDHARKKHVLTQTKILVRVHLETPGVRSRQSDVARCAVRDRHRAIVRIVHAIRFACLESFHVVSLPMCVIHLVTFHVTERSGISTDHITASLRLDHVRCSLVESILL